MRMRIICDSGKMRGRGAVSQKTLAKVKAYVMSPYDPFLKS
jgi:hypothetical protein